MAKKEKKENEKNTNLTERKPRRRPVTGDVPVAPDQWGHHISRWNHDSNVHSIRDPKTLDQRRNQ